MKETTEKFTGKAEIYAKYRPSYPSEYIKYLLGSTGVSDQSIIADIGAGTGIFTGKLLDEDMSVLAVEPNEDMRNVGTTYLSKYPKCTVVNGTAENTTIMDKSVDLITVAQAFHWFDKKVFKKECQRILKSDDNKVALVWNFRNTESVVVKELDKICRELCPQYTGFNGGIMNDTEVFNCFFRDGSYEYKVFNNDIIDNLDGFIGRALTSSYAPKQGDAYYDEFIKRLNDLFEAYSIDGLITLSIEARSYIGRV